jgi:AcrR family transcriptional regulator
MSQNPAATDAKPASKASPGPNNPIRVDETETRERILVAAESLVEKTLASTFTLKQIAEVLNIHYTAVYHYFRNRDDVELQLINRYSQRRSRNLANAQQRPGNALERLTAFIDAEMHEVPTPLLISGRSTLAPAFREKAIAAYKRNRIEVAEVLKLGVADGSMRHLDPHIASHVLTRTLDRFANQHENVLSSAGLTTDDLSKSLIEFFTHGILGREKTWTPPPPDPNTCFSHSR